MQSFFAPLLVAFAVSLAFGPVFIPLLQKLKFGQIIRDDGPQAHLSKQGTPTMGGLLIILAVMASAAVFIKEFDTKVLMAIITFVGFGLIGFIDDILIIKKNHNRGLRAWQKMAMQIAISSVIAWLAYKNIGSELLIPFTEAKINLGIWIIPIFVFFMVGMSNSVNLTDGLDGLAAGVSLVYFAAFALIFTVGLAAKDANMQIITTALTGGLLGFIFFNRYPARIFMGDTGSLALGGMVAYVAIASETLIWLPVMGIMFVLSSISVMIQVFVYKRTKKRVFKMAPLHHHFEHLGYHEISITVTYVIITIIVCILGLLAF
ncbi:MAG: phospho-N-acetylmuramoyl-pentapeptide-transferase [Eubacteriales bacterium]